VQVYKTKVSRLSGTSYREIEPQARRHYNIEKRRTKRKPYVRSTWFKNDKVFLNRFWDHLSQKPQRDRKRRLKYFPCGLDLVRHSKVPPTTKLNPNKKSELFHKFTGLTPLSEVFFVQIVENKNTGRKYLVSIFPV